MIQLVNHGVSWEFYGIRLRGLGDLTACLVERYKALSALHEQALNNDVSLIEPSTPVKLMDLITVVTQYMKRAADAGVQLPVVQPGTEMAVVLGPGVVLAVQGLVAAENPLYTSPPPNYN